MDRIGSDQMMSVCHDTKQNKTKGRQTETETDRHTDRQIDRDIPKMPSITGISNSKPETEAI